MSDSQTPTHETSVMLMGATGLIGRHALPMLAESFDTVWLPGRRPPEPLPGNGTFIQTDFEDLSSLDTTVDSAPDVLCIAFGTTIRDAGSQNAFRRIDFDYPLALARWAQNRGTRRICLISAVGADAGSRVFYSRTKGELEDALRALPLDSLHILRPSLLLGPHKRRPMETVSQVIMGPLAPVIPAKYRPIKAEQLARRLTLCATDGGEGTTVLEGRALFE